MKFQIKKVDDKVQIEVLKGSKVLFTKNFEIHESLDHIKEQLRKDVQLFEVKQEEKLRLENKKNEFKQLIGKKINL